MSGIKRRTAFAEGPTAIRHDLLEYLKHAFPIAIEYAREEWGDDIYLAEPQHYIPYEMLGISHRTGPILGVGITGTQASQHVDYSDALEAETLTRYAVRLYLWCYTPEDIDGVVAEEPRHEALRLRDDMSTLLRAILFTEPGLNDPDKYQVHADTIREEFSDGTQVPNASGRYIAAVAMSFALDVEERLHRPVLGFVSGAGVQSPGVQVQGDLLPRSE